MKRQFEGFLVMIAWMLCPSPVFAAESQTQKAPLIIGTVLDSPPYSFLDGNGRAAGYNVDLTRAIAQVMQLDVEMRIGPWGELLQALETGEIDAIAGMFYSAERDRLVDFSPPYIIFHHAIFMRRDAPPIETEEDLRGKDVIVMNGDIMHEYLLEKSLSDKPILVDTPAEALRLLDSGKHDCAILARLLGFYWATELGLSDIVAVGPLLRPSQCCYAVKEGNTTLRHLLSEGLTTLGTTGAHKSIYDKWLGVLEPRGISPDTVLKYIAITAAPLLLFLLLFAIWSRTLKRQVAQRTKEVLESEERFRDLAEMLPEVVFETDRDLKLIFANQRAFELFGYSDEDLKQGLNGLEMIAPEDLDRVKANIAMRFKGGNPGTVEYKAIKKDGSTFPVLFHASSVMKEGELFGFRGIIVDITGHRQAEEILTLEKERAETYLNMAGVIMVALDTQGIVSMINRKGCDILGYDEADILGKNWMDNFIPERIASDIKVVSKQLLRDKTDPPEFFENLVSTRGGEEKLIAWHNTAIRNKKGEITGTLSSGEDITERKRVEESLRKSEAEYRTLVSNIPGVTYRCANDKYWTMEFLSDEVQILTGHPSSDFIQNQIRSYSSIIYSQDTQKVNDSIQQNLEERRPFTIEYRIVRADGEIRWVFEKGQGLFDSEGQLQNLSGVLVDITERRRVEEENAQLEKQYHQSQKVESIGRLAGGVAHDLNNLLTPILGYSEILMDDLDPDDTRRDSVDEILQAGFRARDLVRQLLAFSRKQTLVYRLLDMNKVLTDFVKLLRRTIREDIAIDIIPSPDIPTVMADIGQVEQVVMNLAVNAQDAMPGGGHLTIKTATADLDKKFASTHQGVKPGAYVMLAISDTGCGMDDETRGRVFEPFFSTKGEHGTGLGMATVYGIVKQHGGNIWVYSEPGKGTTVKVYLPVSEDEPAEKQTSERTAAGLAGTETILLAEDNEQVRDLTLAVLKQQGYTVLVAENGGEALMVLDQHDDPVHLLLTDVVMPEMNGRELFDKVAEKYPNIKVLFMSGYTDNVIAHRGVLDEGITFIQKPFTVQALASKVREVLDA